MTDRNFNRTYREYQPGGGASGPPTERICRPNKCKPDDNPDPPNLPFDQEEMDNNHNV